MIKLDDSMTFDSKKARGFGILFSQSREPGQTNDAYRVEDCAGQVTTLPGVPQCHHRRWSGGTPRVDSWLRGHPSLTTQPKHAPPFHVPRRGSLQLHGSHRLRILCSSPSHGARG